ncbi:MAG: glycosyltransferase family 2 protein [Candidatus Marinimicrobia bacterium]|nr:glycosyltransferase family 2 protein [Candidatus Neomarinimicrobiota bacterium]
MNKIISVLIAAYNEEAFLELAIKSVLNQEDVETEIIVVDDGSSDNTAKIARRFEGSIKLISFEKNRGKVVAFNTAFEESTGQFICFLGGDDELPSNNLSRRRAPLGGKKNSASLCKIKMISTDKRFDGTITPKSPEKGAFSGGAMMMTRDLAEKIFPIPAFLGNEDQWSSEVIKCFSEEVFHSSYAFYHYRIHAGNDSKKLGSFKNKTESMHKRFIVYGVFLEKYRFELSAQQRRHYENLSALEILRYNKSSLSIILFRGVALRVKLRYLFHSNAIWYFFRKVMNRLLSGWG